MVGWWHSHPFFCRDCPQEKRQSCAMYKPFFSTADEHLHRTVFPKAYSVALVLTASEDGLVHDLYGWHEGAIRARGLPRRHPRHFRLRPRGIVTMPRQGLPFIEQLLATGEDALPLENRLHMLSTMRATSSELGRQVDEFLLDQVIAGRAGLQVAQDNLAKLGEVLDRLGDPPWHPAIYLGPVDTPLGGPRLGPVRQRGPCGPAGRGRTGPDLGCRRRGLPRPGVERHHGPLPWRRTILR